ncbi:MAG: PQ-loop domain-containing transporter [Myxococcota bacterium]
MKLMLIFLVIVVSVSAVGDSGSAAPSESKSTPPAYEASLTETVIIQLFGIAAVVLSTMSTPLQIWRVYQTKDAKNISQSSLGTRVAATFCYLVYAFFKRDWIVLGHSTLNGIFTAAFIYLKWMYGMLPVVDQVAAVRA